MCPLCGFFGDFILMYIPELHCYFLARLSFPRGLVPQRPKKSGSLECLPSLHFRRSSTPSPPRRDGPRTGMGKGSFCSNFRKDCQLLSRVPKTALCWPYQALGLVSISWYLEVLLPPQAGTRPPARGVAGGGGEAARAQRAVS
jgi:hypothetical protein